MVSSIGPLNTASLTARDCVSHCKQVRQRCFLHAPLCSLLTLKQYFPQPVFSSWKQPSRGFTFYWENYFPLPWFSTLTQALDQTCSRDSCRSTAASPWLPETDTVPYATPTVGPWPLGPTSQSAQTKAVSAQEPLADKPHGQIPSHKQAQLAGDEALGWPPARTRPARSWAEHSPLADVMRSQSSLWGEDMGPLWPRSHKLPLTRQLQRNKPSPGDWRTDSSKTPKIHEAQRLGPPRVPSKAWFTWSCSEPKGTHASIPGNSERTNAAGMGSAPGAAHSVSEAPLHTPPHPREPPEQKLYQDIRTNLYYPSHVTNCLTDVLMII